jgi:hypothetical protein
LIEPENDTQALRPGGSRRRGVWKRMPVAAKPVTLQLDPELLANGHELTGTRGIWLRGNLQLARVDGLEDETRALSLFVVNERAPGERGRLDEQLMFQVELELALAGGIVPRPDLRGDRHKQRSAVSPSHRVGGRARRER